GEIADHVENCARCQRVLDELTSADSGAAARPPAAPPAVGPQPDGGFLVWFKEHRPREAGAALGPAAAGGPTPLPPPAASGAGAGDLPAVPDYEVLGELGRGGMGVVYRCRDLTLGREVAVKVLRTDSRSQPELAARFAEEAEVGGQLNHPGIVPV